MFEDFLSDSIKCHGNDNEITAAAHEHLGHFHSDVVTTTSINCYDTIRKYLKLSESHFKEASRIYMKVFGSSNTNHPMCSQLEPHLLVVTMALDNIKKEKYFCIMCN